MLTHLVLLRPRADLSSADREALLDAMRVAFANIPGISRVRIGRRKLLGRAYDELTKEHFEYAAMLEFDDEARLRAYLDHPAHADFGARFYQVSEAALVYDFVTVEPEDVRELLE
jgi:hypothetical protein